MLTQFYVLLLFGLSEGGLLLPLHEVPFYQSSFVVDRQKHCKRRLVFCSVSPWRKTF
jgi:hypothetical protein